MTPGDSVSFVASMEPVVIQVAAIVIAAGVLWMASGVSDVKKEVAVLSVLMKGVRDDLEAIQTNYVHQHNHDAAVDAIRREQSELGADLYALRDEHLRCRACGDARAAHG